MRKVLMGGMGFGLAAAVAVAQNDACAVADVVSIENRPGYMQAYRMIGEGEEAQAVPLLEELLERHGDDPDAYMARYNIACAEARQGHAARALNWLRQAIDGGYGLMPQQIQNLGLDPDLDSLRGTPGFLELQEVAGQRFIETSEGWDELTRPFVYAPPPSPEHEGPRPLLILLQGFGGDRETFARAFVPFAERHGFVLLAPCPSLLISPGRWTWFQDEAGFLESFRAETRNLWLAKQQVVAEHDIDPERIYVSGVGQGAALGFALAERNPQWVRGAVLFGGGYAPSVLTGWLKRVPHWGRRVRLVHGAEDPVWPLEPLQRFVELCHAYELPVELKVHPGGGGLPADLEEQLSSALDWIDGSPFPRPPLPADLQDDYERMPQIDPPVGPDASSEDGETETGAGPEGTDKDGAR